MNYASRVYTIILLLTVSAVACDYCLLTQGISPLETSNGFGIRLDQRYTHLGRLLEDNESIDANGAKEIHSTTQFSMFYSITPKLTVLAVVPFVYRQATTAEEESETELLANPNAGAYNFGKVFHGGEDAGSASGIGDISMLARLQVFNVHGIASTFLGAIQAGIRLPTGATDATYSDGDFLDVHIQPGYGAPTYLVGTSLSYTKDRLGIGSNFVVGIAGTGEVAGVDYEYGQAANYEAYLKYRLNSFYSSAWNIFVSFGIGGEYHGREVANGLDVTGTGGSVIFAMPGIQVLHRKILFEASYWQPFAHSANETQLAESFKALLGVSYLFR